MYSMSVKCAFKAADTGLIDSEYSVWFLSS